MKKLILAGILSLFCFAPLSNTAQAHDYPMKSQHHYKQKNHHSHKHTHNAYKEKIPEHAYKHNAYKKYNYGHRQGSTHYVYTHASRYKHGYHKGHGYKHYHHKQDDSLEQIIFKFILKDYP